MHMHIESSSFSNKARIPSQFTCDGNRLCSPALYIERAPKNTVSFALIMDDPDVPKEVRPSGMFVHWVLFNIPADTTKIPECGTVGTPGVNTRGDNAYTGPCPPPEYEPKEHRYFFKLYALDTMLELSEGASKEDLEKAMDGHILDSAELVGTYARA